VQTPAGPLAAPVLTSPPDEHIFTDESFRNNPAIQFNWNSVSGALSYELVIYQENRQGSAEIFRTTVRSETGYRLNDLSILDRGSFRWQVTALDGSRRSAPAQFIFALDIGGYEASEGRESGVLFGKE
jgi:hypothetical protein